jgi:hypothetical protein
MPHPRVRRLLARGCLRQMEGVDELERVRPYLSALAILLLDVPDSSLKDVRLAVLDRIEQGFADAGEEAPRWVTVLRGRLSRVG